MDEPIRSFSVISTVTGRLLGQASGRTKWEALDKFSTEHNYDRALIDTKKLRRVPKKK